MYVKRAFQHLNVMLLGNRNKYHFISPFCDVNCSIVIPEQNNTKIKYFRFISAK